MFYIHLWISWTNNKYKYKLDFGIKSIKSIYLTAWQCVKLVWDYKLGLSPLTLKVCIISEIHVNDSNMWGSHRTINIWWESNSKQAESVQNLMWLTRDYPYIKGNALIIKYNKNVTKLIISKTIYYDLQNNVNITFHRWINNTGHTIWTF
jgi:hypothetical protein